MGIFCLFFCPKKMSKNNDIEVEWSGTEWNESRGEKIETRKGLNG